MDDDMRKLTGGDHWSDTDAVNSDKVSPESALAAMQFAFMFFLAGCYLDFELMVGASINEIEAQKH
jgi:hypothetical protein